MPSPAGVAAGPRAGFSSERRPGPHGKGGAGLFDTGVYLVAPGDRTEVGGVVEQTESAQATGKAVW
jgi:hypothetical protein